ncbi:MAG: DUF5063 domain-containing protein [Pseudomonadota bacterium]
MRDLATLIERLEGIIDDRTVDEDDAILGVAHALDALLTHAQEAEYAFDDTDYPDPPEVDAVALRARVARRFPRLGHYNVAAEISTKIGESECHVGDAARDLEEILADLTEIKWRLGNTSTQDAHYEFQFGFRTHWGRHARELQLYIHDFHW